MKHPDDHRTIELPMMGMLDIMAPAPAKRGRGRPRKPDALTPAQRAKRYRLKQLASNAQPSSIAWYFPNAARGSLADLHGFRQP